jgi:hypothetical protein
VEIGRFYERYIGYLYEMDGWDVEFFGAVHGFEDMGRDLICKKGKNIEIVQAKCWSENKTIREKHIFQLFGTVISYDFENKIPEGAAKPVLITTTNLSDIAKFAANRLGIIVKMIKLDHEYPMIKCNVNKGEKIYHLPFDQQYDRIKISYNKGEFYVKTATEAEQKGFRRAHKWFQNK